MAAMTPGRLLSMLYEHGQVYMALVDDGNGNLKQARYYPDYEQAGSYVQRYCEVRVKKGARAGFAIVKCEIVSDA